ncbi:MAG: LacI family DNA-binding transcriptional regulator, partial [Candidatus Limnocylindrales bacterium]
MSSTEQPVSKTSDAVTHAGSGRRSTAAPTMRDIAAATGVSQSTVSRVLSGTPTAVPIAAGTRKRVMETARLLGYRPNPLARGLRGAPTMLLGVIVRDITDPFFAGAIEAASLEANKRGYNVVLGHAHESVEEAEALTSILEARHCDALLFLGDLRDRPQLIEELQNTSIPVVALWHGSRESGIPTVSVDNRSGTAAVVDHLAALGHERIGFAGPRGRLGDITEREDAFVATVHGYGLPTPEAYRRDATNSYAGGAAALGELMELPEPPTAIVAPTDVLAMGMLHEAHQRGLRVPADVSITGFDDIPEAAYTVPALTTVRMPTSAMVLAAVDLAIGRDEVLGD